MASEGKIVLKRPNQVRRGWQWAVRRTRGLIVALGAMMLASYVTAILAFPKPNGRIVLGDATHHFVQLRSLVFDRDLDFHNEYVRIYNLVDASVEDTDWVYAERTTTGRVRNYMPVGPAILWAPLYVLVALVSAFAATLGWIPPPDGYGVAFQLAPGITGLLPASETGAAHGVDLVKAFPVGSDLDVIVLEADAARRRIRLSVKAIAEAAEKAEVSDYAARSGAAQAQSFGSLADKLRGALESRKK